MKVLFVKDVPGLAEAGEVREVADGFGKNYLIPKGLAVPATPQNIKREEERRRVEARRAARLEERAKELAKSLEGFVLTLKVKVGEKDQLFGSVGKGQIQEALKERGFEVDRRQIELEEPIKELGEHEVPLKLAPGVEARIKVRVEKGGA